MVAAIAERIRARDLRHAAFDHEPRLSSSEMDYQLNHALLAAMAAEPVADDTSLLLKTAERMTEAAAELGAFGGRHLAMAEVLRTMAAQDAAISPRSGP